MNERTTPDNLRHGKETIIDIAAGQGDFLAKKAKEYPERHYVALEPARIRPTEEKIPNLSIIQWKSDIDSSLPFKPESIDEANINFLLGQIKDKLKPSETEEEVIDKYRRIIVDLKRVLKDGGLVRVTDAQLNIRLIKNLLSEEGYAIVTEPAREPDENKTQWTKIFSDAFRAGGLETNQSFALPMTLEAEWRNSSNRQ